MTGYFLWYNISVVIAAIIGSFLACTIPMGIMYIFISRIDLYNLIKNKMFNIPGWEIALSVIHPKLKRPRYLSLHTIACILGRNDLLNLAKEMRKSGKVNIFYCNQVQSPVFALKKFSVSNDNNVWDRIPTFLKLYPFPKYKGFCSRPSVWASGIYGVGKSIIESTAMTEPFIKNDYMYANDIIKALHQAGKIPAIEYYNTN